MRRTRILALLPLVLAGCATDSPRGRAATPPPGVAEHQHASPEGPMPIESRFASAVDRVIDEYLARNPQIATFSGVHAHDTELPDMTAAGRAAYATWLRATLASLRAEYGAPGALPATADPALARTERPRMDYEVLVGALESELVDVGEEERWKTDPGVYHQLASDAIYPFLVREFAPAPERLETATRRMAGLPALLQAGKQNLVNPSELATRVAMEEADGSVAFFRDTFPQFIESSGADAAAKSRAESARQVTLRAVEDYRSFLQNVLLERSTGDYHLGRTRFMRRIAVTEGITDEPQVLRERATREIARLREQVEQIARHLAPHQSPARTMARLGEHHPTGTDLLPAYRERQDRLRTFLREHDLVTFPAERDVLELIETPQYLRSMIVAACDSPGAFETRDRRTYFWVTPVNLAASPESQEEYLRSHYTESIDVISIHEAYPGHHVQLIQSRQSPSRVRRLFWSSTFGEGWAHYTEQMMLDEGYGAGDDRLRLAQLQDALLRATRMLLDVAIHADGMSYQDARDAYQRHAYMERAPAEMEAKRVALNPGTVLVYTAGKMQILALREEVRAREGDRFTLKSFHDRLLSAGNPPIALLRREVFGIE